jgi:hypothetical protein
MTISEAASRAIALASKVYDYYSTELPKRYPRYPLVDLDEESVPPPPEERELRDFLASLPAETVYQLLLLLYLGRGYFGMDELAGSYESLKSGYRDPQEASGQLLRAGSLAEDLADGLEELRKHNINVDRMPLKKVKTRKR